MSYTKDATITRIVKCKFKFKLMVNFMTPDSLKNNDLSTKNTEKVTDEDDVFSDIHYICKSTCLIVDSLKRGVDVAQLSNGDILITEVKTVNTQYSWDKNKRRMFKVSQR